MAVENSLTDYWTDALPAQSDAQLPADRRDADLHRRHLTGCGDATAEVGPFYCPADDTIYLDTTFFEQVLQQQLNGPAGEFVEPYVLAHEYGHHIQNVLGTMGQVQTQQGPNSDAVRLELQADCYAGMWAKNATSTDDAGGEALILDLTQEDIQQAIEAAKSVGDDRIQEQTTGRVNQEQWTHGSAAARMKWFQVGYSEGTLRGLRHLRARHGRVAALLLTSLLVIVPTASLVGLTFVAHRRWAPEGGWLSGMAAAGAIFSAVATGLAVLIAFLIVATFDSYQTAREATGTEAVAVQQQYSMAPTSTSRTADQLHGDVLCYGRAVVTTSWPAMERGQEGADVQYWVDARWTRRCAPRRSYDPKQIEAFAHWLEVSEARQDGRRSRLAEAAAASCPASCGACWRAHARRARLPVALRRPRPAARSGGRPGGDGAARCSPP